MKWASLKNGQLLKMADGRFDVLLTVDKNLRYQNNFTGLNIGGLTVMVRINKLQNIIPLVDDILSALHNFIPGSIICVGSND